ncbi:peroxiredoxin [Candidatus Comchoanobacter bicostacola]|uniref:Thioredoxin peroxidase n=1 Tax=Candidatus Comchoanobacter bicostacola TaxID=2919598 RepID=A0ABY5DJD0_9GAMM|nr:peroxiredoxin [Candidatus Comchoanobacter bicostacola]UTC24648.1 peroxiredoxin [Candidatus Comchoanobacter bicostacola]
MSRLIGQKAPEFSVCGVDEKGEFQTYTLDMFKGKYVVLFFYPMDFTFVCPLELVKMSQMAKEFAAVNTQVLGVSLDSEHTHLAWRSLPVNQGGVGALNYPLLADITRKMTTDYEALHTGTPPVPLRATVIIDPNGIVRVSQSNDLPIGRNPQELLRLIKAVQFHDIHGDVCPPNWSDGEASLEASKEGLQSYLDQQS